MAKVELFLILKLFGSCKNYFKNHCKKHHLYRRKLAFFSVFLRRAAVAVCAGLAATLFCACGGGGGGGGILPPVNEPDKNCCIVTAQNTAKTQINAQTLQILQNSGNNLTWLLEWYDQNNRKCSQNFPFDTKSFNLDLQNGNARPVLLYLLVNGKKYFYPAGAVFPNMAQSAGEAGQNIQLNLDFVNGVCAEVLADILQTLNHNVKDLTLNLVRLFYLSHVLLSHCSEGTCNLLCNHTFVNEINLVCLHRVIQLIRELQKILIASYFSHSALVFKECVNIVLNFL